MTRNTFTTHAIAFNKKNKVEMKTEKARLDLIPAEALYGMAAAFADGADKRSAHNWEVGPEKNDWTTSDRLAAIMRHTCKLQLGEDIAEDSGIHHAAHILANAAMLYTAAVRGGIGTDDRVLKEIDNAIHKTNR